MKPKITLLKQQPQQTQQPQQIIQQTQGSKIKGLKEVGKVDIDPSRSEYFKKLYEETSEAIRDNAEFRIQPFIQNNAQAYQYINFTFLGKNEYQGKAISGVLKLMSNHPKEHPSFYFNDMKDGKTIQHENIYGGGLLCIPQINEHWKESMSIYEVLQAIEFIFRNPNNGEGDSPANAEFASKTMLSDQQRSEIRKQQALLMDDFEEEEL